MTDLAPTGPDLFGYTPPPLQLVRLDRRIDREHPCHDNIAVVHPRAGGVHAADLLCRDCNKHRGFLPHVAMRFIKQTGSRWGAPALITLRDQTIKDGDQDMPTKQQFEQKDGSGALFKNDRKEQTQHPDYTGNIKVEGVEFQLSAWLKKTKAGRTYMSLSAMPKQPPGRPVKADVAEDLNDEIGF
jgi:hypothetical protein